MSLFDLLVLVGAVMTLIGFAALIWCIWTVWRARRAALPDDDMRALLQRMVPVNFGALGLSVLGLMLVVVGIVFA